jgi:hypothetical protein
VQIKLAVATHIYMDVSGCMRESTAVRGYPENNNSHDVKKIILTLKPLLIKRTQIPPTGKTC